MTFSDINIIGCGYVGKKLAHKLKNLGYNFTALVKSEQSYHELKEHGYVVNQIDLDNPVKLDSIPIENSVIFYFVPPPNKGITDKHIQHFLDALHSKPARIIMISTTGVYGDCKGEWVDESWPLNPQSPRAERRVDSENKLISWCEINGCEYIILRVPGIYGDDKLPEERIKSKKPVLALSESPWSNRIHVDDLVQACIHSMLYEGKNEIFNVSDGHPSTMSDYFIKVAKKLNLPEPPQISLEEAKNVFSENMMSYLVESKKIDNKKMLGKLGVKLKFPDLTLGLKLDT